MAVGREPTTATPELDEDELELLLLLLHGVEQLSPVLLILFEDVGVGIGWETPLPLGLPVATDCVVEAEVADVVDDENAALVLPLLTVVEKNGLCVGLNASGLTIVTPSSSEERCLFLSSSLSSVELHLE